MSASKSSMEQTLVLLSAAAVILAAVLVRRVIQHRQRRNVGHRVGHHDNVPTEKDPYQDIEPLDDFDWATTTPIRQRPFKPKYHLTMALENLPISELIAMDNTYRDRMRIRRDIMDEHPESTLQCNLVAEAPVLELYDWMMRTYLPKRFPRIYKPCPDEQSLLNRASDEAIPLRPTSALSALRTLGDHVDTDFLLLLPSSTAADGTPIYHLQAFVVCFPAGFSTRSLLGKPLAQIHAPVPGYKAKLAASMDRFFARLECGKAVKRANWAIMTDDRLFSEGGMHLYRAADGEHAGGTDDDDDDDDDGAAAEVTRQKAAVVAENCKLRSERQTLFRLPQTKALVFAFKTYTYRLDQVKAEGDGPALAEAIEGLPKGNVPDMNIYKRGVIWSEKVLEYLRT